MSFPTELTVLSEYVGLAFHLPGNIRETFSLFPICILPTSPIILSGFQFKSTTGNIKYRKRVQKPFEKMREIVLSGT